MNKQSKILITGGAGFIGSCLLKLLNDNGFENLLIIDNFTNPQKNFNLEGKSYLQLIPRDEAFTILANGQHKIEFIFHLGGKTSSSSMDQAVFEELNENYSKHMWNYATENEIPFIYASTSSTYGTGEHGYDDAEELIDKLEPLKPYEKSKHAFDSWALRQKTKPPAWAGLKFFNVYGPNEYHKGRSRSVVLKNFQQISESGKAVLFGANKPGMKDGAHARDFIYVKDVIKVCFWFMQQWEQRPETFPSGIYNVGTGIARSYNDLAKAVFKSMGMAADIGYRDLPADLRQSYPDRTQAEMDKLKNAGYHADMYTLEEGVYDYVTNYLLKNAYF